MNQARAPIKLLVPAFVVPLLVYAFTLAPSVGFVDAGELAAAAHTFGITHPTGYPVFTLVAGIWSHLPLDWLGSVIFRLNMLSALVSALAAGVCADLAWRLLARAGVASPVREAGALAAAGVFAFDRVVWADALSIEVYSLHALMVVLVLRQTACAAADPGALQSWRTAAFVLGLAFANHLTTVQLLPGLALVFLGLFIPRHGWRAGRALAVPFLIGLVPYLYLPLRAAQDPPVSWGDLSSISGLWAHVTAREYGSRFFMGVPAFLGALRGFVVGLPGELGALPLLLALVGVVSVGRRDRGQARVLGLLFATSVAVATNYAIPDIEPYFLLAHLTLALLAGFGVAWSCERLPHPPLALPAGAAAAVVASALLANASVPERGDYLVEDFTRNMFRSLEPHAIVISYQWDHWLAPALYAQTVLGVRPDVVSIDKRLCQRAWYLRQLARRHPDLCEPAAPRLREAIALAEDPAAATPAGALATSAAIDAFLQAVVDTEVQRRPIYVTVDVEETFPTGYRQVPEGLALRLYAPGQEPAPDGPVWDAFAYRPFGRHDPWTDRLRQYYAVMLMARGAWLENAARPDSAAAYYERALGFEPSPSVTDQLRQRLARARAVKAAAP